MSLTFRKELQLLELDKVATHLAFTHDGRRLAVGLAAGKTSAPHVEVYDTGSGKLLEAYGPNVTTARGVAFAPSGDLYFLLDYDTRTVLYKLKAGGARPDEVCTYSYDDAMNRVACDATGKYLAVFGRKLEIFELPALRTVQSLKAAEHTKEMRGCFSNVDSKHLYLYGSVKGQLVKIDWANGAELGRWKAPRDFGDHVSVSANDRYLAALGPMLKGTVVYDLGSDERILTDEFEDDTTAGPPVFVRDELIVAPAIALSLPDGDYLKLPRLPQGTAIAGAAALQGPIVAFSNRHGFLYWIRLQED